MLKDGAVARYLSRVDRGGGPNACWPWKGRCALNGYGVLDDVALKRRGPVYAHRIAWFVAYGEWPALHVCHHCDNRPCCNPDHLFQGTDLDNMRDASAKGRLHGSSHPGEAHPSAKLTDAAVREIRALSASGATHRALARRFGVSASMIGYVVARANWSHVL